MISLVLPSRNEKMLRETVESGLAAGADEVIVIDDHSSPEAKWYGDPRMKIHRNKDASKGPSYCRNLGGKMATGDVIIYSDAHVKFPPDGLKRIAELAIQTGTVVSAATKALDGTRNWTGYGGIVTKIDAGYDVTYNRDITVKNATGYIGSVYGATKKTWEEIGWWPHTNCWGYNEQALSLAVLYAGKNPVVASDVVCLHHFKRNFNYPVEQRQTRVNRLMVHYQCCENFFSYWLPLFRKTFRTETELFMRWLSENRVEAEDWRQTRILNNKRSDKEVDEIISTFGRRGVRADRELDAKMPTITLFTPFAAGREKLLPLWALRLSDAGTKISNYIFMLDNERPDVVEAGKKVNAKILYSPHPPENPFGVNLAGHIARMWNLALPHMVKSDYILSLEDDVFPPSGFLNSLLKILEENPNAGAAGIAVRSRHSGCMMAYKTESLEPFVLDRKAILSNGKETVDSISFSCTLIRTSAIAPDFQLTAQPNLVNGVVTGNAGAEFSLMKHMRLNNHVIIADFSQHCEHTSEPVNVIPMVEKAAKEKFHNSKKCLDRQFCYECRNQQGWREQIAQEYIVPPDFHTHCPQGVRLGIPKKKSGGCNCRLQTT